MGELQWAVLIVCVALVIALYVFSRRGKRNDADAGSPPANADQSDLFTPPVDGSFDQFGVGRARSRGQASQDAPVLPAGGASTPIPPSVAALLKPLPGQSASGNARSAPSLGATPPQAAAVVLPTVTLPLAPTPIVATPEAAWPPSIPTAPSRNAAPPAQTAKLVALIVAPTEETDILGPQLHQALVANGLQFGEGDVYHRLIGGRVVYSVAGLLKPGKLVPSEAETFSTRGLTVVMRLPGPVKAEVALDDMVATTRALAATLKADIFDARRERLSDAVSAALRAEVQEWAQAQKVA